MQKYMARCGIASRRKCESIITDGKVSVNGKIVYTLGSKIDPNKDKVTVNGKVIKPEDTKKYIMLNKPEGYVTTNSDEKGRKTVLDLIDVNERIYPIGRLDKESDGLILLTNNGEITDRILRSVNGHEKEYIVKVNKNITKDFLDKMSAGVYLKELNVKTKQCRIYKVNSNTFRIVLTQGLNRQIRRMCQELGYKVEKLTRIRVMNIELGDLACGEYRVVEGAEKEKLYNSL